MFLTDRCRGAAFSSLQPQCYLITASDHQTRWNKHPREFSPITQALQYHWEALDEVRVVQQGLIQSLVPNVRSQPARESLWTLW